MVKAHFFPCGNSPTRIPRNTRSHFYNGIPTITICLEFHLGLNPSYPEYINHVKSGVMCFDFHHTHSSFLAVGLYDGSVRVFNTALSIKQPQYRSDSVLNKHQGVVWEVVWGKDMSDGEMNFFSVSSDGRIFNWILLQNQLQKNLILNLYLAIDPVPAPDGNLIQLKACGTAIAFHPDRSDIFLIGTEEGKIYQCSTVYPSVYLCEYQAHHMPVHALSFNYYNSSIFLSCSADWRVKIWEDGRLEPLFVFDLGCSVGGVKWAPYSSSVFAAVTRDSKVWVYDVNVNKYHPVCCQQVTSSKKFQLTRLSFNYKLPVLIVGDDKGYLTTLKLSPNCRIKPKPPKKQQHLDPYILEVQKLDKLLSLVREPSAIAKQEEESSVSS
ncbi:hypothetical protein M8J76_016901 [Diaphorina citri]|nr:hypothetical protein M8J76_016901 [Diaphorina citri]